MLDPNMFDPCNYEPVDPRVLAEHMRIRWWQLALVFVGAWALACALCWLIFLPSRRRAAQQAAAREASQPTTPVPPAVE